MINIIFLFFIQVKTFAVDIGTSAIQSTVRQPTIQVTENPNQINTTAKDVFTDEFYQFEKKLLNDLKKANTHE